MACRSYSVFTRDRAVPGLPEGVAPLKYPGRGPPDARRRARPVGNGGSRLATAFYPLSGRKGTDKKDAGDGDKVFRYQHQV